MTELVVSRLAQIDSAFILRGLSAKAGNRIAARYAAEFAALYEQLLGYPESGPMRSALGPNVRIGVVSPYIVIYEYVQSRRIVTILRIIHGRRRVTGELLLGD